jgi:hypothetical protein
MRMQSVDPLMPALCADRGDHVSAQPLQALQQ